MPKKKENQLNLIINKLEKHDKRFDEIATNFDKVFGELEIIREDKTFALAKDRELEQRIKVLEDSRA